MNINKQPIFTSWSGGKDSCLSLYRAIQAGAIPRLLLTVLREDSLRSRSHGLMTEIISDQAEALGLKLMTCSATWDDYEAEFIKALKVIRGEQSIDYGVFGDIDIDANRQWVLDVCKVAEITAIHPIWQGDRKALLTEFIQAGFKAQIVSLKDGLLPREFLGRTIDNSLINEMENYNVDPCGENGEFHTVVTDGPMFKRPVHVEFGNSVLSNGYWFADTSLKIKA